MIWRDGDFGYSEKLGRSGEVASGTGGGRIQESAYREDGNGMARRRVAKVKVGQERLLAEQAAVGYGTWIVGKMGLVW